MSAALHEPLRTASRAAPAPLHVVQVGFHCDPQGRTPLELLAAWPTLRIVAEAVARSGLAVSIVQAAAQAMHFAERGVRYHFLPLDPRLRDTAELGGLLTALAPDVLHVHGLGFPRGTLLLHRLVPAAPILLRDHADHPPAPWRRPLWRRAFAAASGVAFCARPQAEPFLASRLLPAQMPIYEIPECTALFAPGDRARARAALAVAGAPVLLWVGHLDHNKDPLVVLEGVSRAVARLPGLSLYCCFDKAPLSGAVRRRIVSDAALRGRVHLLGRVPHAEVEQLMRAADYFVLGSHRESTGYALLEALACGLTPIVTDIASFRALTGQGKVGALWPPGDAQALCDALCRIATQPQPGGRERVRAHFERELSSRALGARLAAAYRDLVQRSART